ncbi:hypothetical protein [Bythopirellula goksoeyrii]|uniref:Uncharacterized protein n=1 Tax=Bythopirellula goksoeyrii TaxID=1400387 RepID=A0A5B9QE39_9BACT|nr:hypothetical protein [Bythopirellula goksoeyrii]QEG36089.1 hypothetical protein Pr1d_33980 [Bythopirellula goksoeyrii]
MTIHVEIPDPLAAKVTEAARTQGTSPAEIVLEAVTRTLDPLADLRELMAPVYPRMEKLGITEDEAVEDFERIKHELRYERKTARS